jgi:hypothetical protein
MMVENNSLYTFIISSEYTNKPYLQRQQNKRFGYAQPPKETMELATLWPGAHKNWAAALLPFAKGVMSKRRRFLLLLKKITEKAVQPLGIGCSKANYRSYRPSHPYPPCGVQTDSHGTPVLFLLILVQFHSSILGSPIVSGSRGCWAIP